VVRMRADTRLVRVNVVIIYSEFDYSGHARVCAHAPNVNGP